MKNKVYYGEYSLKYWTELMLTRKIVLPEYQRHFVWNEERLRTFINTLKERRFIPPVTIGSFKRENDRVNYIIDGQQRLTCILLAYLGVFPNKDSFKSSRPELENEDLNLVEDDSDPFDDVLEWTFEKLTEKGKSRNEIREHIKEANYKSLNLSVGAEFFEDTFLGFSYIVPDDSDTATQQKYYTKVFRELNLQGVNLLALESRRSLYFLNEDMEGYFEPSFASQYKVSIVAGTQRMDFARYLCFMAAYKKHNDVSKVARGYGYRMEEYFENYIYSVVDNTDSEMFGKFDTIFPEGDYSDDINRLAQTLQVLDIRKDFPSIINMDVYFFGLVYHVLFCHQSIDVGRKKELTVQIESAIRDFKVDPHHLQSPAQFKHMRARILKSVEIYQTYILP